MAEQERKIPQPVKRDSYQLFGQTIHVGKEIDVPIVLCPFGNDTIDIMPKRVAEAHNILSETDFEYIDNCVGNLRHKVALRPTDMLRGGRVAIGYIGRGIDLYFTPIVHDDKTDQETFKRYGLSENAFMAINWTNAHLGACFVLMAAKYGAEQVMEDLCTLNKQMYSQKLTAPKNANKPQPQTLDFIARLAREHYTEDENDAYNIWTIAYMGGLMEEHYTQYYLYFDINGHRVNNRYYTKPTMLGRHSKYFIVFAMLYNGSHYFWNNEVWAPIVTMSITDICESTAKKPPQLVRDWFESTLPARFKGKYNYDSGTLLRGELEEFDLWQVCLEKKSRNRYHTTYRSCAGFDYDKALSYPLPKDSSFYLKDLPL